MDIRRILTVNEELITELGQAFEKGTADGKTGEWILENTKKFVANPDNIFLLAYKDGWIAGMVSAYLLQRMDDLSSELFFYEIGVHKDFRKQGIGKALIEELKKIGREMGTQEMFVLTNASNIPAMRLYESTGGVATEDTDGVMLEYKI